MSVFLLPLMALFSAVGVYAEPWLSARYAQNCSGCHAPARRNVPVLKRRCTLSCQGCHVNPNGGGMRNQYGVWNSQRWLRSFRVESLGDKKSPAPLKEQKYAKQRRGGSKRIPKGGHRLVTTDDPHPDESNHDRGDKAWAKTVKNRREFMERATVDDPYRLERSMRGYAGADYRYLHMIRADKETSTSFPMALDLGVRMRPLPEHVSMVVEQRFMQGPAGLQRSTFTNHETLVTKPSQLRAAYVLVDDLPFNTYLMGGHFKPMFGHDSPDHTALHQRFKGFGQRSRFRAISVGTAPNVPFLYAHFLVPEHGADTKVSGYSINAGGRFVTMGLAFMLSYWDTTATNSQSVKLGRKMVSLTGGGYAARTAFSWEWLYVRQEFEPEKFDAGNIYTLEAKLRAWRENYLTAGLTQSDIAPTMKKGSAQEVKLGVKSFPVSGVELDATYARTVLTDTAKESSTGNWLFGLHLYM